MFSSYAISSCESLHLNISCPGAITLPGPEAFESLTRYFRAKAYINSGSGFQFWTRDGASLYKTLQTSPPPWGIDRRTHMYLGVALLFCAGTASEMPL